MASCSGGCGGVAKGYESLCTLKAPPDTTHSGYKLLSKSIEDALDILPEPLKKRGRLNADFGVCGEGCGLPQTSTSAEGNTVEFVKRIGAGAFSDVWRGIWTAPGGRKIDVAAKVLYRVNDGDDPNFDTRYRREVAALKHVLGCQNVVQFVGAIDVPTVICTLYVEGKTLHAWLDDYHPSATRLKVAISIAIAIGRIHSLNLAHRDINSSNIIVQPTHDNDKVNGDDSADHNNNCYNDDDDDDDMDGDDDCEPIICDFGLACGIGEPIKDDESTCRICHPRWRPPEITRKSIDVIKWDKCDVWCYGLLLWEIATCTIPYAAFKDNEAGLEAACGRCPPLETMTTDDDVLGNKNIPSLIKQCLSYDPSQRPSFDYIIDVLQK